MNQIIAMRSALLVFVLLIPFLLSGQVAEGYYKIMSDDDEVGYLVASKKEDGNIVKYEIYSDISIRILFKIQMTNEILAVFKNGILQYSTSTLYLNGKLYSDTKIKKENGFYTVLKDDQESKINSDGIGSSSAKLYFKQPIGEATSLSETEGELKEVDLQGVRKYSLTETGNSKSVSTYTYSKEDQPQRIKLVRPYVPELSIYRVQDSSELKKQ